MEVSVKRFKPLSGKAKYHLMFLHGMNSNPRSLENIAINFQQQFKDAYIYLPTATFTANTDYENFRWFNKSLKKEEMLKEVESSREEIAAYIGYIARQENIPFSKVILCGFSQGAMMALYTAPRLKEKISGIISFSGNLIFPETLATEIKSKPDILLLHGTEDKIVPYSDLVKTAEILQKHFTVKTYTSQNTTHTISSDMLKEAAKFIKNQLR